MARAARRKKIQTCSFQKFKTPNVHARIFQNLDFHALCGRCIRVQTWGLCRDYLRCTLIVSLVGYVAFKYTAVKPYAFHKFKYFRSLTKKQIAGDAKLTKTANNIGIPSVTTLGCNFRPLRKGVLLERTYTP